MNSCAYEKVYDLRQIFKLWFTSLIINGYEIKYETNSSYPIAIKHSDVSGPGKTSLLKIDQKLEIDFDFVLR